VNNSATALLASSISAVVAMAVVGLQHSLERRRQQRADRAERLGAFFAASHAVALSLGTLARAPLSEKERIEAGSLVELADRMNSRFAQVRLLEDREVMAAATLMDRELVRLTDEARTKQWSRADWREARAELSRVTNDYQTVARAKLGAERQ
jgi:hypothetical protein